MDHNTLFWGADKLNHTVPHIGYGLKLYLATKTMSPLKQPVLLGTAFCLHHFDTCIRLTIFGKVRMCRTVLDYRCSGWCPGPTQLSIPHVCTEQAYGREQIVWSSASSKILPWEVLLRGYCIVVYFCTLCQKHAVFDALKIILLFSTAMTIKS